MLLYCVPPADFPALPTLSGSLAKWTNYIHGWQSRFFVVEGGELKYYKSEHDMQFGCRGTMTIGRAIIQVSPNYLLARTLELVGVSAA